MYRGEGSGSQSGWLSFGGGSGLQPEGIYRGDGSGSQQPAELDVCIIVAT